MSDTLQLVVKVRNDVAVTILESTASRHKLQHIGHLLDPYLETR